MSPEMFNVIDLFSGAGGMSFGFHKHPAFRLVGGADAELGKPSSGQGKLQCNTTYSTNIGLTPTAVDLSKVKPEELKRILGVPESLPIHVLSTCPPCTGFSRQNPQNHLRDDKRNSLVRQSAEFAVAIRSCLMDNERLYLYSGAGIVEGSAADTEWKEIETKLSNTLAALGLE